VLDRVAQPERIAIPNTANNNALIFEPYALTASAGPRIAGKAFDIVPRTYGCSMSKRCSAFALIVLAAALAGCGSNTVVTRTVTVQDDPLR
jgi:hypothetical protein